MVRGLWGDQIDRFWLEREFVAAPPWIMTTLRIMIRDDDNDNDKDHDSDEDNDVFSFLQESGLVCHLLSLLANLADCRGGGFFFSYP